LAFASSNAFTSDVAEAWVYSKIEAGFLSSSDLTKTDAGVVKVVIAIVPDLKAQRTLEQDR
jgi:hypothetical protein